MQFGVDDRLDEMVELLEEIAGKTGDIDIPNHTGIGTIAPQQYNVFETDDLDDLDQGDALTVEPGEEATLVRAEIPETTTGALCAVGATDETDCQYWLEVDRTRIAGGRTNSPLGLLTEPFSFPRELNQVILASDQIDYKVWRDPDAADPVEMTGRLHVVFS